MVSVEVTGILSGPGTETVTTASHRAGVRDANSASRVATWASRIGKLAECGYFV